MNYILLLSWRLPPWAADPAPGKKSGGLDCSKPPLVVWACQKGCCTTAFFLGRRPAVDYVDYIERKIAIPQKQNPPNQFRDINRGRDIVADTLVPVLIFRGKVSACRKNKEW